MRPGIKMIQAGDLSIYTEYFGNSEHPACLLIAGAMATARFWTDTFCLKLSKNFFVIRYDHRDIGDSSVIDWQKNPYSLTDLAADAIDILDGYAIKKAHCIGHSMGGYICQRLALNFPERILSLSILSSGPICATSDTDLHLTAEEKAIQERTWHILHSRKENSIQDFLPVWRYLNGSIPLDENMASIYTNDLLTRSPTQIHPGNNHELVMRKLETDKCPGILKYLQIPTLIIHGKNDPLSLPRDAQALARAIPQPTLRMIPDMGHMIFNQELELKIVNLIIAHLKSVREIKNWTSASILQAMEANLQFHMTYFAGLHPNIKLLEEPDVTVVQSNISDDTYNYVVFAKFTEQNVEKRVGHVCDLFKKLHLPFSWWAGEADTPSCLIETLLNQGLMFKEKDTGMVLDLETWVLTSSIKSLKFQHVSSEKHLQDFSQVMVGIGGNPDAFELFYSQIPPIAIQAGAPLEMHVAYLNEIPIVTGILVLHAHVAGVYYVATIPEQRKKGYGTAMMEYLLSRAKKKGFIRATLQASHEGKNLYERMGFMSCCHFKEYAWRNSKINGPKYLPLFL